MPHAILGRRQVTDNTSGARNQSLSRAPTAAAVTANAAPVATTLTKPRMTLIRKKEEQIAKWNDG